MSDAKKYNKNMDKISLFKIKKQFVKSKFKIAIFKLNK